MSRMRRLCFSVTCLSQPSSPAARAGSCCLTRSCPFLAKHEDTEIDGPGVDCHEPLTNVGWQRSCFRTSEMTLVSTRYIRTRCRVRSHGAAGRRRRLSRESTPLAARPAGGSSRYSASCASPRPACSTMRRAPRRSGWTADGRRLPEALVDVLLPQAGDREPAGPAVCGNSRQLHSVVLVAWPRQIRAIDATELSHQAETLRNQQVDSGAAARGEPFRNFV
jgi:hypothetical protein